MEERRKWKSMRNRKRWAQASAFAVLSAGLLAGSMYVRTDAAEENLAQNGSFEDGKLTGWTENSWCLSGGAVSNVLEKDGDVAPTEGSYFLKHEGKGNGAQITQNLTLKEGQEYWLTGDLYQTVADSLSIGFQEVEGKTDQGQEKAQSKNFSETGKWVEHAVRFTMWDDSKNDSKIFTWINAGATGYVDDIVLKEAPDYSDLEAAIADTETQLGSAGFTEESEKAIKEVLAEARDLADPYNVESADKTQDDVDQMTKDLKEAVANADTEDEPELIEGKGTYYIDAQKGDDSNDGTSEDKAWKTFENVKRLRLNGGGKVLLKAGCTWNGEQFLLQESKGTKDEPIIVGRYGEGDDPVINGQGNPWQTDVNAPKEDVAVVHILDCEYVTVENLEVTNWESDEADLMNDPDNAFQSQYASPSAMEEFDPTVRNQQSKYLLTAILVENNSKGDLAGITVQNNYVHDVNGRMEPGGKKGTGGILALVTGSNNPSSFVDLEIIGNRVENICHQGIYMESSYASRDLVGSQQAGSDAWKGWKDVYVADNWVNEIAGDGIVLINVDGGVAEKNLVTATANGDWNYSRNPAHAAIWMWDCNNVTMQYNEAAYTESYQDGMAFDFDYGNQNVMYQYNYSHDNKGGFWMSCPGPNYTVNAVARYNVSVNDGLFDGARIIRIGERGSIGNQFYNNTMYWDHGYEVNAVEQATWGNPPSSGTDVYNNIFCGDSSMFINNDGVNYSHNLVFGGVEEVYPFDEDANAVVADPGFVEAGKYTTGSYADGKVTLGDPAGFRLTAESPCIDAGREYMEVPNGLPEGASAIFNFDKVKDELVDTHITLEYKDYDGNAVPYADGKYDIGAFEFQGEAQPAQADTSYLEALIDMVDSYDAEDYPSGAFSSLKQYVDNVKGWLENTSVNQATADAYAAAIEAKLQALYGTNILAEYKTSAANDNSGFEAEGTDWGVWQSEVSVSSEQARTGSNSLKIVQKNASQTAYSEIGNVPVTANTTYVLEGYLYCTGDEAANVKLEAKHHNNVTGSGDIKLGNAVAEDQAGEAGWRKVTLEFTTKGYNKISISVNSDIPTVYLDDVTLYEKGAITGAVDTAKLEQAIADSSTPEHEADYYTEESWAAYEQAMMDARLALVDVSLTQDEVDARADALTKAFEGLTKAEPEPVPVDKSELQKLYETYSAMEQGDYTDESWNAFQAALTDAKSVLDNEAATEEDVANAVADLKAAFDGLKETETDPGDDDDDKPGTGDDNKPGTGGNAGGNGTSGNGSASGSGSTGAVQTGDTAELPLMAGVCVIALMAAGAVIVLRRRAR